MSKRHMLTLNLRCNQWARYMWVAHNGDTSRRPYNPSPEVKIFGQDNGLFVTCGYGTLEVRDMGNGSFLITTPEELRDKTGATLINPTKVG